MLTPDFPLPLLLGIAEAHLRRWKRLRLDTPAPGRDARSESTRELRPTMFVPTGRYAKPRIDVGQAEGLQLNAPDGLDLQIRRGRLYLPLAQLDWSAGTPPVVTKDGLRLRIPLGERFVLRLLGGTRRWVLDVRGLEAELYEDHSPVVVPYLGRPPAESWARTIPMPTWLATLLEEVATGGDDLSPLLAVGLVLRHAGTLGAGTPAERLHAALAGGPMPAGEAVEWLRAVAEDVDLKPVVGEARARADALAARIVDMAPGDAAAAVAICRDREHLACTALALRSLRRGATLSRRLTEVDTLADEHLATLDDALAGVEDLPVEVVLAPTGWWAGEG